MNTAIAKLPFYRYTVKVRGIVDKFIGFPVLPLGQLVHFFGLNRYKVVRVSPLSRLLSLYFFVLVFEAILIGLGELMSEHNCGWHVLLIVVLTVVLRVYTFNFSLALSVADEDIVARTT